MISHHTFSTDINQGFKFVFLNKILLPSTFIIVKSIFFNFKQESYFNQFVADFMLKKKGD